MIDFCDTPAETWFVFAAAAIVWGLIIGYLSQAIFTKSGIGLTASEGQNFAGGCLAPVVIAMLSGVGVNMLIPDDPCDGAYSSVAGLIPPFVVLLAAASAIALFWAKVWRR